MKLSKTDRKTSNKLVVSTGYACVVAELVNDDEPSCCTSNHFVARVKVISISPCLKANHLMICHQPYLLISIL